MDEYAVLVLAIAQALLAGAVTLDLDVARRVFLAQARRMAQREHERLARAHEGAERAFQDERLTYAVALEAHQSRAEAHARNVRVYDEERREREAELRVFEREWLKHDELMSVYRNEMQAYESAVFKGVKRLPEHPGQGPARPSRGSAPPGSGPTRPAEPTPPEPPPSFPSDRALMQSFVPESGLAWAAELTTRNARTDIGGALPERIGPAPAVLTETLNLVAADGWRVHHVAEDRTMVGDEVRLVAVRYLLRRDG